MTIIFSSDHWTLATKQDSMRGETLFTASAGATCYYREKISLETSGGNLFVVHHGVTNLYKRFL